MWGGHMRRKRRGIEFQGVAGIALSEVAALQREGDLWGRKGVGNGEKFIKLL